MRRRSRVSGARRVIFVITPAQSSPAQPRVSGDRSVSHEDKTQDSGYFTNFAELLDPEMQSGGDMSRGISLSTPRVPASTPLSPSIGPHGTDVFTHKR